MLTFIEDLIESGYKFYQNLDILQTRLNAPVYALTPGNRVIRYEVDTSEDDDGFAILDLLPEKTIGIEFKNEAQAKAFIAKELFKQEIENATKPIKKIRLEDRNTALPIGEATIFVHIR